MTSETTPLFRQKGWAYGTFTSASVSFQTPSLPSAPHSQSILSVIDSLQTDLQGLSHKQAADRLLLFGPNKVLTSKSILLDVFSAFISSWAVGLYAVMAFSFFRGWWLISLLVLILCALTLAFTVLIIRTAASIGPYKQNAVVRRAGERLVIPAVEVVLGDIVLLKRGDSVPADLRLVEAHQLGLQQHLVTELWEVIFKHTDVVPQSTPVAEQNNLAFAGSMVVCGSGVGVVIATGPHCLSHARLAKKPEYGEYKPAFDRSRRRQFKGRPTQEAAVSQAASWVAKSSLACLILWILLLKTQLIGREALSLIGVCNQACVLRWVILMVSLTLMPLSWATLLRRGPLGMIQKLASRGILVDSQGTLERLSQVDTLLMDKTGTLTRNRLTLELVWLPDAAQPMDVSARLQQEQLAFLDDSQVDAWEATIPLWMAWAASTPEPVLDYVSPESAFTSPLTSPTNGKPDLSSHNTSPKASRPVPPPFSAGLSSFDYATLKALSRHGDLSRVLNKKVLPRNGAQFDPEPMPSLLRVLPFDPWRRRSACLRGPPKCATAGTSGEEVQLFCRGAPEDLLDQCTSYLSSTGQCKPLSLMRRNEIEARINRCGQEGRRVVGFARRRVPATAVESAKQWTSERKAEVNMKTDGSCQASVQAELLRSQQEGHPRWFPHRDLEEDMTFLGIFCFRDKLQHGVTEALKHAKKLHVTTKLLTGDGAYVARTMARQAGVLHNTFSILVDVPSADQYERLPEEGDASCVEPNFTGLMPPPNPIPPVLPPSLDSLEVEVQVGSARAQSKHMRVAEAVLAVPGVNAQGMAKASANSTVQIRKARMVDPPPKASTATSAIVSKPRPLSTSSIRAHVAMPANTNDPDMHGSDMAEMQRYAHGRVFSRLNPDDKRDLIEAHELSGHTVLATGGHSFWDQFSCAHATVCAAILRGERTRDVHIADGASLVVETFSGLPLAVEGSRQAVQRVCYASILLTTLHLTMFILLIFQMLHYVFIKTALGRSLFFSWQFSLVPLAPALSLLFWIMCTAWALFLPSLPRQDVARPLVHHSNKSLAHSLIRHSLAQAFYLVFIAFLQLKLLSSKPSFYVRGEEMMGITSEYVVQTVLYQTLVWGMAALQIGNNVKARLKRLLGCSPTAVVWMCSFLAATILPVVISEQQLLQPTGKEEGHAQALSWLGYLFCTIGTATCVRLYMFGMYKLKHPRKQRSGRGAGDRPATKKSDTREASEDACGDRPEDEESSDSEGESKMHDFRSDESLRERKGHESNRPSHNCNY